jgi:phosphate starvation-inducible membrane PsiE
VKKWRVGQLQGEPRVQPQLSRPEERLTALYERAESVLTSVVALFLMGFVVVALAAIVAEVRKPLFVDHDFTLAALKGIDASFLAIILLELLHTTLSRGPISQQVQEFLVIGITAAVRHGLELAASGPESNSRDVVISLVLNSVGAVVLVVGLWLVRQQLRADRRAQREDELGQASVRPDVVASSDADPSRAE